MNASSLDAAARRVMARIEELALITDDPPHLTRLLFSPAMALANQKVGEWMRSADLAVVVDDWGNLVGRFASTRREAKTLLLGSHLDSVRQAGKYDGPLGVILALAALEVLAARGVELPFHVDVLGFSDEEGARFHTTYLGSRAIAGTLEQNDLARCDGEGISLAAAVKQFRNSPAEVALPAPRYRPDELLGYVEAHIEQGPVLEADKLALGVVEAIAAQNRLTFTFTGKAGHAGTTPMGLRRDALAGAAEFISRVETIGKSVPGLVATVGQATVRPGVSNVIPGKVRLSLDVRHAEAKVVEQACSDLIAAARELAAARKLEVLPDLVQSSGAVPCDVGLTQQLARAVAAAGQASVPRLVSGAGHDGVALARLCPIAMLFVRCREGLSHHPDEHVELADVRAALAALVRFLEDFA